MPKKRIVKKKECAYHECHETGNLTKCKYCGEYYCKKHIQATPPPAHWINIHDWEEIADWDIQVDKPDAHPCREFTVKPPEPITMPPMKPRQYPFRPSGRVISTPREPQTLWSSTDWSPPSPQKEPNWIARHGRLILLLIIIGLLYYIYQNPGYVQSGSNALQNIVNNTNLSNPYTLYNKTPENKSEIATKNESLNTENITIEDTLKKIALLTHQKINIERTSIGLDALNWDENLTKLAVMHDEDMINYSFFEHEGPNGEPFEARFDRAYINFTVGENIFKGGPYSGYGNDQIAEKAVDGWMNSPGHRKNILNPIYTKEAIGVILSADGYYYFTEDFGSDQFRCGVTGMSPCTLGTELKVCTIQGTCGSCADGFKQSIDNQGYYKCYPTEPFYLIQPYLLFTPNTLPNITLDTTWEGRFSGGISKTGLAMWISSFDLLDMYVDTYDKAVQGFKSGEVVYYNKTATIDNKFYYATLMSIDWKNETDGKEFSDALPIHAIYNSPHAYYKQFNLGPSRTAIRFGSNIDAYGNWPYNKFYGYIYLYSDYHDNNSFIIETDDLSVMKSVLNQTGRDYSFVDFMQ